MNSLSPDIAAVANEQAILNVLMYLPYSARDGSSLEKIINDIDISSLNEDEMRQYTVIKNAIRNNPDLADLQIGNQSGNMGYDRKGLNACTFTDPKTGSVYFIFRGTGSGEWLDNGYGISGKITETPQQKEALEYFNTVVKKNGYAENGTRIIISGHSKGGNKSQFVTVNSEYNYLIDMCFNFDGQGMSPEAIQSFRDKLGEQAYQEAVSKIHGFYSANDYVNPLGISIVPEDQRYYFENSLVDGIDKIIKHHYMDGILNEDGSFTKQVEEGDLSKFIRNFSEGICLLPPDLRSIIADSIMALMQGDKESVDGSTIPTSRVVGGLLMVVPLLIIDLISTPDGWEAILDLAGHGLATIMREKDTLGPWGVAAGASIIIISVAPFILKYIEVGLIINACEFLKKKLIELGKAIPEATDRLVQAINNWINGFKNWCDKQFNVGYNYAVVNPKIIVDTHKLRAYATRLTDINKRLRWIDERLNALYLQFGFLDLLNLLRADFKIGWNDRINRCVIYLNETASDFEAVERSIIMQLK